MSEMYDTGLELQLRLLNRTGSIVRESHLISLG